MQSELALTRQLVELARTSGWGNGPRLAAAVVAAARAAPLSSLPKVRAAIPSGFSPANGDSLKRVSEIIYSRVDLEIEGVAQPGEAQRSDPPVVVVTALPVERNAVLAALDGAEEVVHPLGTVYRLGTIPGTHIKVAVVEIGQGNAVAAAETERALSFFSPAVALFVGIAGGLKDDISKGDVVIGDTVYDYAGGKETGEGLLARPRTHHASYALVSRARLVADQELEDGNRVFVKPIAAGPRIVATSAGPTAALLKQLAGDALAVEMEGAGFMQAAFPHTTVQVAVVRGVSDLVDDKEGDNDAKWQPIASAHAAAVAVRLIRQFIEGG